MYASTVLVEFVALIQSTLATKFTPSSCSSPPTEVSVLMAEPLPLNRPPMMWMPLTCPMSIAMLLPVNELFINITLATLAFESTTALENPAQETCVKVVFNMPQFTTPLCTPFEVLPVGWVTTLLFTKVMLVMPLLAGHRERLATALSQRIMVPAEV